MYKTGVNLLISMQLKWTVNDKLRKTLVTWYIFTIAVCRERNWPSKLPTDQYHMTVSRRTHWGHVFFTDLLQIFGIGSQGSTLDSWHRYSWIVSWLWRFQSERRFEQVPLIYLNPVVGKRMFGTPVYTSVLHNSYYRINLIIVCSRTF